MEDKKERKKLTLKKVLKKVKLSHIIILIVLLAANSYAWFIFIDTVSNSVDVHVKSWRIDFVDGTTPVTEVVNVYVDNVYPGMTTFNKQIEARNYSDVGASVEFKILEADVMGTTYITEEGRQDAGEEVQTGDLTSAQLINKLANDYPFAITFSVSTDTLQPEVGSATYSISIAWPYESGNDAADTYWGASAYSFKQSNPTLPCIKLIVKIYITQANPSGN